MAKLQSGLVESAEIIHKSALLLAQRRSVATTTKNTKAPPSKEEQAATSALLGAISELTAEVLGPENYLKHLAYSYHDVTALSVVLEFNIAEIVPQEGDISFDELAARSGCDCNHLERVLRLFFVRHLFYEPRSGYVAHTPASAELGKNAELAAFLGHCTHEAFPAASRLAESLRKWPSSEEPNEAGFNLAFGTTDPLFTFLCKNPTRFDRFNLGMAGISKSGGRSGRQVVEGFPWADLGDALVIDVGGGNGHVSVQLAENYPQLKFVVQDLPNAVAQGVAALPSELGNRVAFEAHDMFTKQTAKDVDIFYLRHILHDWPDKWAIKILANLVPAMKEGSRILISDSVIPPPEQLDGLSEKLVRYLDMQMMVLHNARERTEADFAELLRRADPRLRLVKVWKKGEDVAASTMVEAILDSDSNGVHLSTNSSNGVH